MATQMKPQTSKAPYDNRVWEARKEKLDALIAAGDPEWDSKTLPFKLNALDWRKVIKIDYSRNALITEKGAETLQLRYYLPGETDPQHVFARVACAGADDEEHAQRLYDYISKHWFMPATPVLSNLGGERGLPISCFLQEVEDSLHGIAKTYDELTWMAARGGGVGTSWSKVRSIGEKVGNDGGTTSGIIPFIRIEDSYSLGISQGSIRRGAAVVYLDVDHPEIEEFLEIRKPSGDFNRKSLNLHNGVVISDAFMEAVRDGNLFELRSPKDGEVRKTVDARKLFQKIVELRLATGEPYILFKDTVNRLQPTTHKKNKLLVSTSNLCIEITLPTGRDHHGKDRTAVCCLSSLNLAYWDEWKDNYQFVKDVLRLLDNVMETFVNEAPHTMERAAYSAWRERSVGLGVMGFHSLLQSKGQSFGSPVTKGLNRKIFKTLKGYVDLASNELADERGACPDAIDAGENERFVNKMALAPTASISVICGGSSPTIEPWPTNAFNHKTLSGSTIIKNRALEAELEKRDMNTNNVWNDIIKHGGSIQHIAELSDIHDVFQTAAEIDPRTLLDLQADRTQYICQSTSLNLFVPQDINKWDLLMIHYKAWELGIKSLYYLRSQSIARSKGAVKIEGRGDVSSDNTMEHATVMLPESGFTNYDECLACQ